MRRRRPEGVWLAAALMLHWTIQSSFAQQTRQQPRYDQYGQEMAQAQEAKPSPMPKPAPPPQQQLKRRDAPQTTPTPNQPATFTASTRYQLVSHEVKPNGTVEDVYREPDGSVTVYTTTKSKFQLPAMKAASPGELTQAIKDEIGKIAAMLADAPETDREQVARQINAVTPSPGNSAFHQALEILRTWAAQHPQFAPKPSEPGPPGTPPPTATVKEGDVYYVAPTPEFLDKAKASGRGVINEDWNNVFVYPGGFRTIDELVAQINKPLYGGTAAQPSNPLYDLVKNHFAAPQCQRDQVWDALQNIAARREVRDPGTGKWIPAEIKSLPSFDVEIEGKTYHVVAISENYGGKGTVTRDEAYFVNSPLPPGWKKKPPHPHPHEGEVLGIEIPISSCDSRPRMNVWIVTPCTNLVVPLQDVTVEVEKTQTETINKPPEPPKPEAPPQKPPEPTPTPAPPPPAPPAPPVTITITNQPPPVIEAPPPVQPPAQPPGPALWNCGQVVRMVNSPFVNGRDSGKFDKHHLPFQAEVAPGIGAKFVSVAPASAVREAVPVNNEPEPVAPPEAPVQGGSMPLTWTWNGLYRNGMASGNPQDAVVPGNIMNEGHTLVVRTDGSEVANKSSYEVLFTVRVPIVNLPDEYQYLVCGTEGYFDGRSGLWKWLVVAGAAAGVGLAIAFWPSGAAAAFKTVGSAVSRP